MNIESNFLPYELSLLMKEKGFDEPCLATWINTGNKPHLYTHTRKYLNDSKIYDEFSKAILFSQATEWLREKHGLYITIWHQSDFGLEEHDLESWNYLITEGLFSSDKESKIYFKTEREALTEAINQAIKLIEK